MSIFKKLFRKSAIERGFRYLVKPEFSISIVVKEVICEVRDISITGIGIVSEELTRNISKGEELQASIRIGEEIFTLDLKVVWYKGNRFGAKIITHQEFFSEKVRLFIEELD
jgi:hypothetical protein